MLQQRINSLAILLRLRSEPSIGQLMPVEAATPCVELPAGLADAVFAVPALRQPPPPPPRLGVGLDDTDGSIRIADPILTTLPDPALSDENNRLCRELDQNRPLWEMYLIEGLEGGRFAILSKSHHAMVDGMAAVDIGQVILDVTPEPRAMGTDVWRPAREPTSLELLVGGVADSLRSPATVVDSVKSGLGDIRETAVDLGRNMAGVLSAAATVVRPPAAASGNPPRGAGWPFIPTTIPE